MSGETILTTAARVFGITAARMQSCCRSYDVAHARQAVMYALRQDGWTLQAIGALLRRDHQTVLHGAAAAERRAVGSPKYAAQLAELLPDRIGG